MLKVKKENRVIDIDDRSLRSYLNEGYDHVEIENGQYKVVTPGHGKTVPYEEYAKLKAELDELKSKAPKK